MVAVHRLVVDVPASTARSQLFVHAILTVGGLVVLFELFVHLEEIPPAERAFAIHVPYHAVDAEVVGEKRLLVEPIVVRVQAGRSRSHDGWLLQVLLGAISVSLRVRVGRLVSSIILTTLLIPLGTSLSTSFHFLQKALVMGNALHERVVHETWVRCYFLGQGFHELVATPLVSQVFELFDFEVDL